MNFDKMKKQLIDEKLRLVEAEIGELSYQDIEFITTGCEKDVLILDKKTVVSFFREGLQLDSYNERQELIRRLEKNAEPVLPECIYISSTKDFVVEKYVPGYRLTPQYIEEHLEHAKLIGSSVGKFLRQLHVESVQGLALQTGFAQDVQNDMEEGLRLLMTKLSESEMSQVKVF